MEDPIKVDDLRVPVFQETPMWYNAQNPINKQLPFGDGRNPTRKKLQFQGWFMALGLPVYP